MNINATIIVQTFNFFIAYCMFRFILFKPAYAVIEQDAKEKRILEEIVEEDQQVLANRMVERELQWDREYAYFRKNSAPIPLAGQIFRDIAPHVTITIPSQENLKKLTIYTSQELIKVLERHNGRS